MLAMLERIDSQARMARSMSRSSVSVRLLHVQRIDGASRAMAVHSSITNSRSNVNVSAHMKKSLTPCRAWFARISSTTDAGLRVRKMRP